jgi:hypothetical protein
MPVCQIQCKTVRCSEYLAAVSSKMQGYEVQFAACLFVRYIARQCCAVWSMPVYQIQCKVVMCSVQHACVSDTMQGSDVQCAACLCVRYNARQ